MDTNKTVFEAEYRRRFPTSARLFEEAKQYIPCGVNSTARCVFSGWNPYPLFVDHGDGAYVTDVDGNVFTDYLLGLGPDILGHRPKEVTAAVTKHINEVGTVFALASALDTEVARKMTECVPSLDQVRLNNSGTEAVTYALRMARAYTGRQKIVRFEGMYHGFSDGIYWSKHLPSSPSMNGDIASPNRRGRACPRAGKQPAHLPVERSCGADRADWKKP